MTRPKGTGGRPSKGDRDAFYIRPPRAIGDQIRAEAERLDLRYADYLVWLVAGHLGLPYEPQPLHTNDQQEELPLHKTA